MKLYKNSNGVWAGTQLDARKMCGKGYQTVDVPTDKPSLLRFLNANKVGAGADPYGEEAVSNWFDETKDEPLNEKALSYFRCCLLYTSPSPRDKRQSRMPSSA